MRREHSLTRQYFEDMFAGDADPWALESSAYEAAKFDDTLRALGSRRYTQALEVGCAGGMLTGKLAAVCDSLLALDVSDTALTRARERCRSLSNVTFENRLFPKDAPACRGFDLIVLSEVVYYWDAEDVDAAGRWISSALSPGGDILLVHWLGETDYPQTGDEAVKGLYSQLKGGVAILEATRHESYRLDLWRAL